MFLGVFQVDGNVCRRIAKAGGFGNGNLFFCPVLKVKVFLYSGLHVK